MKNLFLLQQGDSGGPLLRADDGVQMGIVSFAPSNCENPYGAISTFTSVARNLDWIRRTMIGDGENNQLENASTTWRPATVPSNNIPATTPRPAATTPRPANVLGFPFGGLLHNFYNKP